MMKSILLSLFVCLVTASYGVMSSPRAVVEQASGTSGPDFPRDTVDCFRRDQCIHRSRLEDGLCGWQEQINPSQPFAAGANDCKADGECGTAAANARVDTPATL